MHRLEAIAPETGTGQTCVELYETYALDGEWKELRLLCGVDDSGVSGTRASHWCLSSRRTPIFGRDISGQLLDVTVESDPVLAQRFMVNDATTRIESIGWAGEARRRTTLILGNRTGKPALLKRIQEILP